MNQFLSLEYLPVEVPNYSQSLLWSIYSAPTDEEKFPEFESRI